jgi:hypothetical protein
MSALLGSVSDQSIVNYSIPRRELKILVANLLKLSKIKENGIQLFKMVHVDTKIVILSNNLLRQQQIKQIQFQSPEILMCLSQSALIIRLP